MTPVAELILGTAQFGGAYGITNDRGRLTDNEVTEILTHAQEAGVTTLDTARAYGDAEERIGGVIARLGGTWRAITKITMDDVAERPVTEVLSETRGRLGCDRLDVLLHRPADLLDARLPHLLGELREARRDGVIVEFGVSVYDAEELGRAVQAMPDLGLVQIPGSLVDRRLLDHHLVTDLARASVEIHVRSVFLQGLLLAPTSLLPARFFTLAPILEHIDAEAAERGTSRLAVLLSAVRCDPAISGVVVGATTVEEWRAILGAPYVLDSPGFAIPLLEDDILDPRRWNA